MIFFSLILLENKIKPNTKETIKEINGADINTFIITGDIIYTSINIGI